ncbi:MAG: PIN domain-containing protein [Polyangiaceae bacterium]|nr:PIN domain-containing protein [Polyangiaceae bacterium]
MIGVAYANAVLIDTSATVALADVDDAYHSIASECFAKMQTDVLFCAVDVTAHESFTRLRYDGSLDLALKGFGMLRASRVRTIAFGEEDEHKAIELVQKYADKSLSYHDALCAAVMLRYDMFRIFSFDSDFWTFGFELVPGTTKPR